MLSVQSDTVMASTQPASLLVGNGASSLPDAPQKLSFTSHRIEISAVTSPEHSESERSDVKWVEDAPTPVAAESHGDVRVHIAGWNASAPSATPTQPTPAAETFTPDFFTEMPPDCLYSILLLLDGPSLATFSATSSFLTEVASGADMYSVWREVAAADVTRLSLLERQAFDARDLQPMSGQLTQAEQSHGSPRALYLLRMKQRMMVRSGSDAEASRVKQLRVDVLEYKRHQLKLELALEASFMVGVPACLFVTAVLLLISSSFPVRAAFAVFLPIWIGAIGTLVAVALLAYLQRKQEEHYQAELSLLRSSSPSSASSRLGKRVPRTPSATYQAHQKAQRDRLNARFISKSSAPAVARGGPLQTVADTLFVDSRTTNITLAKASLLTASSILLCVRESGVTEVPYAGVFSPLYLLFAWSFTYALFDRSSIALLPLASPYLAYARHVFLWRFPLLAGLVLLTVHLDSEASGVRLAHAFIPMWIWQGVLVLVLVGITLQFALGVRLEYQSLPSDRGSFALFRASCFPYRLKREIAVKNLRLSATVFALLLTLVGILLFEVLLCLRSNALRRGDSDTWSMFVVSIPLVLSSVLVLWVACASARQMAHQRCQHLEEQPGR